MPAIHIVGAALAAKSDIGPEGPPTISSNTLKTSLSRVIAKTYPSPRSRKFESLAKLPIIAILAERRR